MSSGGVAQAELGFQAFIACLAFFHASEFLLACIYMRDELSWRCEWPCMVLWRGNWEAWRMHLHAGGGRGGGCALCIATCPEEEPALC